MKKYSILFILLLLPLAVFANSNHYIVVIDAGSSGTRIHLFQYEQPVPHTLPKIEEIFSERSEEIILASFEKNPTAVGPSLSILLDHVAHALKEKEIHTFEPIPVEVYGTAGMRFLSQRAPDAERMIYDTIKTYINHHDFGYKFTVESAQTLPSRFEALFGWLDVNYTENNFQNNRPTLGSIDVGGASMEIAFETNETQGYESDIEVLTLGNKSYSIFTKSFLGLGLDVARNIIMTQSQAPNCFPSNYSLPGGESYFNFFRCKSGYEQFLKSYVIKMPSIKGQHFIANSGTFYTYQYLYSDDVSDRSYSRSSLEKHMSIVCNKTNEEQLKDYCPKEQEKHCSFYCANGVYLDILFYDVFKLQDKQLRVINKTNGRSIDWPLGAVLYNLVK